MVMREIQKWRKQKFKKKIDGLNKENPVEENVGLIDLKVKVAF
jgi:hypothetical protein